MLHSLRALLAGLLWLCALVPPLLLAVHWWASPLAALQLGAVLWVAVVWIARVVGVAAIVALLAWPPFLPSLRVALQRLRGQMSVPRGPVLEAQARLRHFENPADHAVLGRSYRELGQLPRAVGHLTRALELEPDNTAARAALGQTLLELGDLQGALDHLGRVVQADERHAFGQPLLLLGEVLQRGGRPREAVTVLQRHEQLNGENPRAQLAQARALLALGEKARAREVLRRAAAKPPPGRRPTAQESLMRARAKALLWWRRA